jgi:hypothetical protein
VYCLLGSTRLGGNGGRNTDMIVEKVLEEEEEQNLKTTCQRKQWKKLAFLRTYTRL